MDPLPTMAISTKPRAETVKLAGKLMKATTLDGVTIEDVHHLAARILDDQEYAPKPNRAEALVELARSISDTKPEPPERVG